MNNPNNPKRRSSCGFTSIKNVCEIKKFWLLSLPPTELHYVLLVFLCWMENSCLCSLYIIDGQKDGFYKRYIIK